MRPEGRRQATRAAPDPQRVRPNHGEHGIDLRRTLAALLLLGALSPGLLWRSEPPPHVRTDEVVFAPLALEEGRRGDSALHLAGAWEMISSDFWFGGYSALVAHADGRLRAYSDRGLWLGFDPPDIATGRGVVFGSVRGDQEKYTNDVEAAAHDLASGLTWLALEYANRIKRIGSETVEVAPRAMAGFRSNGGAEALARLPDGRFVVLDES